MDKELINTLTDLVIAIKAMRGIYDGTSPVMRHMDEKLKAVQEALDIHPTDKEVRDIKIPI